MSKELSENLNLDTKEQVLKNKSIIDNRLQHLISLSSIESDHPLVMANHQMHKKIAALLMAEPYSEWKRLSDSGALKIDEKFIYGTSRKNLLHLIAENKDIKDIKEKIHFLFKAGFPIDQIDSKGDTALSLAIISQNPPAIEALIDRDADIHFPVIFLQKFKVTPWLLAAKKGDILSIQKMLKKYRKPRPRPKFDDADFAGMTALHFAAENEYEQVVIEILTQVKGIENFSIDCKDFERLTPLHYAARKGNKPICDRLLEAKADPNLVSASEETPIHFAFWNKDPDLTFSLVKSLLEAGGYLNKMGMNGNTPLHLAARQGNLPLAQLLTGKMREFKIDTEVKNDFGQTPLYLAAAFSDNIQIIELLEEKKSDCLIGVSPAHEAAATGKMPIVKYFLEEKNFKIETEDSRGYTLIFASVSAVVLGIDNIELTTYLIARRANLEHRDKADGRTPLFHATEKGSLSVVKNLLEKKADIAAHDRRGKNILFTLVKGWSIETKARGLESSKEIDDRYKELFAFLAESKELNIHAQDNYGMNLIHMAAYYGNSHAVLFLKQYEINVWLANKLGETPHLLAWNGIFGKVEYRNKYKMVYFYLSSDSRLSLDQYGVLPKYLQSPSNFELLLLDMDSKNIPTIKWLIDRGADVNHRFRRGRTPIFFAGKKNNIEMLNFFLQKGANIDIADHYGRPPFFKKCAYLESKFPEIRTRYLDTPLGICESYDKFPLHEAVQKERKNIVKFLLRKKADPNIEDDKRKRPIDYVGAYTGMKKLLIKCGAKNSILIDFDRIRKQVSLQKSPVIWVSDLKVIFSNPHDPDKSIEISADVHKYLRCFENLFRRRVENESLLRSKNPIPSEAFHNRPKGQVIKPEGLPNYAVAALTFVVSSSESGELMVTAPLFIKIDSEERNIWHVTHFLDGVSKVIEDPKFISASKDYAEEAQNVYGRTLLDSKDRISLDKEPIDFKTEKSVRDKTHHSEPAFYQFLEKNITKIIFKSLLGMSLKYDLKISAGFIIYAMIIDLYTTRDMCGNCVDRTIGVQSLAKSGRFRSNLISGLTEAKLNFPTSGPEIITRISYDHISEGSHHVPSPDDPGSTINVFTHEDNSKRFPDYKYTLIRQPIDIREMKNSIVLASPKKHNSASFSQGFIEATVQGKCTIFTSQSPNPIEEEIYSQLFKLSSSKRQQSPGSSSPYGLMPQKVHNKKSRSKSTPSASNAIYFK